MTAAPARYRGVVFDFDGTLLDSMPLVLEGMADVVSAYRPRPDRGEVMASLGGPSEACLRRLLGGEKHVAAALARYVAFFTEHDELSRLFRGARPLLDALRRRGVHLGLWTGRERSLTSARLRGLRLEGHFEALVCGDDLASHKPDPAGLLHIVDAWGCRRGEVLFVGDSDQDFEGGTAAGVPLVAIRHDRMVSPALLAGAVAVVATPAAAYARVRRAVLGAPARRR